ncbi:MAG: 2-amino-4-hydroxy-6-hydroxymethyldihydropteridine diphosphokinase [Dehalococcoidia bacterium]|nr:2-amino-4-hydroxy-6-hydroxymethyldihydropteridine diphosphokinase [Dehalococcoidia bacterium]
MFLALGSNLGDRVANLRGAVRRLEEASVAIERRSSIWETEPVPAGQPPFLNAAVRARTELDPGALLVLTKAIEQALGRRPGPRWGPRPIDVDILLFGDVRVAEPGLDVPHPRLAERAFVLAPLAEVTPAPLPVLGARALDLLARLPPGGLRRTGEPL